MYCQRSNHDDRQRASLQDPNSSGKFEVPRGALAFSVAMYTGCALVCVLILIMRRFVKLFGNAELGGQFGEGSWGV